MDTLRKHRPDYLPRTGFVWPIDDSAIQTGSSAKKAGSEAPDARKEGETALDKSDPFALSDAPKKKQNNMLMLNAMRTTAFHSKLPVTANFLQEDGLEETPGAVDASATRPPSMTPAPGISQTTGDASQTQSLGSAQEPAKGAPGFGKKKRKRTSVAVPAA